MGKDWKKLGKEGLTWACQLVVAYIFLRFSWQKFTSNPWDVFIFSTLGLEPFGRYIIGALENVSGLFMLHPKTAATGGLLGFGVMIGAIIAHLTFLGMEQQGDGGLLFKYALVVFACSAVVLYNRREHLPVVGKYVR